MYSRRSRRKDIVFRIWGIVCTGLVLAILVVLLTDIFTRGFGRINLDFLSNLPSRFAHKTGIYTAIMGSVWLLVLTILIAFPIGISTAIYLEEYGKRNKLAKIIEINISNLAGVPSIIYGILGLSVFVRILNLGNSLLAGALTLSLLILPILIVATREAIRAVPSSIRDASYGMGATKWQTIWRVVLPSSFGGILTGLILAVSRAIGETAPLIVIGALAYVPFAPKSPMDQFTVLPIQIYNWVSRPQKEFIVNASAGIIILLAVTFMLNGIAVWQRHRWAKKFKH